MGSVIFHADVLALHCHRTNYKSKIQILISMNARKEAIEQTKGQ